MDRVTFSRDSSVPLLTPFVAPVGMTDCFLSPRAERQRSRGVSYPIRFALKKFDRMNRMEQDYKLAILLYSETRIIISTVALAR